TNYDLEMMREMGFCSGIENYSRHLTLREPGSTPYTLLDFFPDDFLVVIDESHATLPQIRGMYNEEIGRAHVCTPVTFTDRLPSCYQDVNTSPTRRSSDLTNYDLEMMRDMGFCSGIENYSRHLTLREPGSTPYTLLDFFPDDFLVVIDESHATLPQIRGMYNGDKARKQ